MSSGNEKRKHIGREPRPVVRIDETGHILEYFPKGKDIVTRHPEWKVDTSAVSNYCNGLRKRCKGFLFRFATPQEIQTYQQIAFNIDKLEQEKLPPPPKTAPEISEPVVNEEAEVIAASTEKPSPINDDGLSPFERLLQQTKGKFGE